MKFVLKFIRILNKDASPRQIAWGMVLGFVIGMTPLLSLHNLLILCLGVVTTVNFSSIIVSWGVFSGIGYILDPVSNRIGYWLLVDATGLKGFWTALYNTPVIPWTSFNNTLTLGSLVLSAVLAIPLYFVLHWAVVNYREHVMAVVAKWRIVTLIKGSKMMAFYMRYSG